MLNIIILVRMLHLVAAWFWDNFISLKHSLTIYSLSPHLVLHTGHDESESLLQRNEGSNAQSILLDDLGDEELSSLSLLFGGVGDGRHAFVTLLDAHSQYQSLREVKQDKFRLHMTLNDIR